MRIVLQVLLSIAVTAVFAICAYAQNLSEAAKEVVLKDAIKVYELIRARNMKDIELARDEFEKTRLLKKYDRQLDSPFLVEHKGKDVYQFRDAGSQKSAMKEALVELQKAIEEYNEEPKLHVFEASYEDAKVGEICSLGYDFQIIEVLQSGVVRMRYPQVDVLNINADYAVRGFDASKAADGEIIKTSSPCLVIREEPYSYTTVAGGVRRIPCYRVLTKDEQDELEAYIKDAKLEYPKYRYTRIWKDVSGKHEREAEFVSKEDDIVHLRLADGKMTELPFIKLSFDDRQYVNDYSIK